MAPQNEKIDQGSGILGREERASPSNLGEQAVGPRAHAVLPCLIEDKQAHAESSRQKPVLNRDRPCVDRILESRNIAEDEDHNDGEDHGREERPVLCSLVEDGRLLEDAESASASSK
jgi:hypothetical protein